MKIQCEDTNLVDGPDLELEGIRIIFDEHTPDKVEIYITEYSPITRKWEQTEGGQFDYAAFVEHVMKFYNERF